MKFWFCLAMILASAALPASPEPQTTAPAAGPAPQQPLTSRELRLMKRRVEEIITQSVPPALTNTAATYLPAVTGTNATPAAGVPQPDETQYELELKQRLGALINRNLAPAR